ncbi:TonB-dependent receptor [Shewanella corallii]|uniref:TonB-dependent receptor n=1 Tax=Shewanella corallii TaxID=560080 RepID=A0ABT0N4F6_9GAMM|nr:TonB-dependent receptor [Shewanella corallii]MCL2913292.1 TonB-dependent receptor [Shewanella corallii]
MFYSAKAIPPLMFLWLWSNAVSGQEENTQENTEEPKAALETITVTAQRRDESVQKVPVAVTAMNADMIERQDVHNLNTIATRVPGLTFSPFSPGQNIISLRGASSNDDGAGTDNSVAVFIDDVYLGRVSNVNPEMFDIERIEVLRGPQGTLYGKNTIGGAINIISKLPNLDELEAKLKLNIGNYSRFDTAGFISGPLSENIAGKLSFSNRVNDGWVNNVTLDKKQKDNDVFAVRGQLLFDNSDFQTLLSADYSRLNVEDMARIPVDTGDELDPAIWYPSYAAVCPEGAPFCAAGAIDGYSKQTAYGLSAKLTWDFDAGQLISISAYRDSKSDWNMDSTGSPALALIDDIYETSDQFSQEFRWVSELDSFKYVSGLWYMTENTDRSECFDLSVGSDCTLATDGSDYYRQVNKTESYAIFGQGDWNFTDDWILTLGGRYSYETKTIDNQAIAGNFVIINENFGTDTPVRLKESWSAFTPKVALKYEVSDDITTYLSYARGFKSGGFPAAPQSIEDTKALNPEKADNIELGIKSDITDTFRLNTTVFHTKYKDLQIQSFGPRDAGDSFGVFNTFNAGDAELTGVELEFAWIPIEDLKIFGFYGYMDSKFVDTVVPNSAYPNQSGQEMLRTPKNKYSINLEHYLDLDSGAYFTTNISYRFTDDQRGELEPYAIQPAFDLIDASVTWHSANDDWKVSVWGKNLADEAYITHLYTVASSVVAVYGEPRMYGVSVSWQM